MIHSSPCVVDGVVSVCDVTLHLDLHFILCSIEVLENVCPVVQSNAVLCLERDGRVYHVRVYRDHACMLMRLIPFSLCPRRSGYSTAGHHPCQQWGGPLQWHIYPEHTLWSLQWERMVMEVMTNSRSCAEGTISYLRSWGTAFQDPLWGTVTVCVEMEEFQHVKLNGNILKPKCKTPPCSITPHLSLTASDWSGQQNPSAEKTTRDLKSLKRWRITSTPATKTTS